MTAVSKCPAQSPLQDVSQRLQSCTVKLISSPTFFCVGSDDITTFQAASMEDYVFFYLKTLMAPLLGLTVMLCMLRYCCKYCGKASDPEPDLNLSNRNHVFVIPNPINVREERDETQSQEDFEFPPPSYELVCPPPSYAEASFKLNVSDVQADSETEGSYVPPPPYSLHLNTTPQSSTYEQ